MTLGDPATLFGLRMALCLTLFLIGAAWLRRGIERAKRAKGPPPEGASALERISHLFGGPAAKPSVASADHERRLYRQTIRILALELLRHDPDHEEAREALGLLRLDGSSSCDEEPATSKSQASSSAIGRAGHTPETQRAIH